VVPLPSNPRADHAGRDDRDLVAGDRGLPDHGPDERPNRGHEQVDQTGETLRLRVPEPGQLPTAGTVALHPANPPIVSEETDGARSKLKSQFPRVILEPRQPVSEAGRRRVDTWHGARAQSSIPLRETSAN
jgi:hypothetical protein